MPATFNPPPNSLASLSLEAESQLGFSGQASSNVSSVEACSTGSLDTGSPTVPCITPVE